MVGAKMIRASEKPRRKLARRRVLWRLVSIGVGLAMSYALAAYVVVPALWRRYMRRHPALADAPQLTRAITGLPGDPLNVALIGSGDDLKRIMLAAEWHPADPLTLRSCLEIAGSTVFHRPYPDAPVSNLFLWGRRQDLAFEQPVGHDARRRHHVRFWKSDALDRSGRPLWIGAATFDRGVGLSRTTARITHHIAPDIDTERDKLIDDLRRTGHLVEFEWVDDFQEHRTGKNGGGDPYYTDGRLAVGVVAW